MANKLPVRLRIDEPNGTIRSYLPHPLSWEMAVPLNDISSFTMTYPSESISNQMLQDPGEVVIEIQDPSTGDYGEIAGARFLNLRRAYDMIARPKPVTYTMPGYGWMLRKARFTNKALLNADGKRAFVAQKPGRIMTAIIDEAHARGNITGLTYNFTNTNDSAGVAWPTNLTVEYDYGQDAWSILETLANQGYVDYRFVGRQLEMYIADTALARNLATPSGVIIRPFRSTVQEPIDRTYEDLAQAIVVVGDLGKSVLVTNGAALNPWGNWEDYLNAGGVKDTTTLTTMGTTVLGARAASRAELTKQLIWKDLDPMPFVDYRPGDFVFARSEDFNQTESQRIFQITLSMDNDNAMAHIHLVMNDKFLARELKNDRWVNRLSGVGGAVAGGGGGGGGLVSGNKQAPPLNANWIQNSTASVRYGPLTYRVDIEGNLHVIGAFHSGIARAAGAYSIFTFPAAYFPQDLYANAGLHVSSADAFKATIRVGVDSLGTVGIVTTAAIAANDNFYINALTPRT